MADFETAFAEKEMNGGVSDLKEARVEWQALGCPTNRIKDESLAYSINALIQKFDPNNEGVIYQTKFYKLLFLLDDDLKEEGVDLKMPYFWYRYGPVVPYFLLPLDNIKIIPKVWKTHSGKCFVISKAKSFSVKTITKDTIDNSISKLWDQYNKSTTKKIIYDVYIKAPYEFQRKYKNFLKHIDHKLNEREKILFIGQSLKETEDIKRLDEAIHFYEKTEFPQAYNDLLQWRLIAKYSIRELETIEPKFLESLADFFWSNLFSRYLRVKEQEDMPEAIIKAWDKQLPKTHEDYRHEFRKLEYAFYSNIYKPTNCVNEKTRELYNECLKPLLE